MRLELLKEPPEVHVAGKQILLDGSRDDGRGTRHAVPRLVRLLVGANGQALDPVELHDDIGLKRDDKKIDDLLTPIRKALGPGKILRPKTAADGTHLQKSLVALDLDGVTLDTTEFEAVASKAAAILTTVDDLTLAPEQVGEMFASELEEWKSAFRKFQANPGLSESHFSFAVDIYRRFADLRHGLLVAIAVAYAGKFLTTGNELHLSQALDHMVIAGGDLADDAWQLRFRLAGALSSWEMAVPDLRTKYLATTREDALPPDLETFVQRILDREEAVLLKPVASSQTSTRDGFSTPLQSAPERTSVSVQASLGLSGPGEAEFMGAIKTLGITENTSLELRGPTMTPIECCKRVIRRLWFSGIMANKWVLDPDAYEAFDELLTRLDVDEEYALVRLMIVNPNGEAAERLKARGMLTDRELASIPVLQDLVSRHASFQVRMYDTMPLFRLIIVDEQFVTVGPYLNRPEVLPRGGWEVPQLSLAPTAPYPLSQAFVGLFEETWRRNAKNSLPWPKM